MIRFIDEQRILGLTMAARGCHLHTMVGPKHLFSQSNVVFRVAGIAQEGACAEGLATVRNYNLVRIHVRHKLRLATRKTLGHVALRQPLRFRAVLFLGALFLTRHGVLCEECL